MFRPAQMSLPKMPRDAAARLLLASLILLYIGIGFGLPLLLSHLPTSESPSITLCAVGTTLLLVSVVATPVLLGRVASLLGSSWLGYGVVSLLSWPVGTFLIGLNLWNRRGVLKATCVDRIRISTLCLFACTFIYGAMAWKLQGRDENEFRILGILVGAYAAGLFVVMGVLAVDLKRWAWRATNAAFIIHLTASVLFVLPAIQHNSSDFVGLSTWVGLGVLGLWANFRPASRAVVCTPIGSSQEVP